MKTFRNIEWLTCILLAISIIFFCPKKGIAASKGKYAGEFLSIGIGGRALGLGGAYTALAGDVTAGYWNPAGLSSLTYPQISLMHDERFAGIVNYDYVAAAYPFDAVATFAISVIRLGVDNIPNTENAGIDANGNPLPLDQWQNLAGLDQNKITYFNAADWGFIFSYANKHSNRFSYGANIKLIYRSLDKVSATGVGFDIGGRYEAADNFYLGAVLQDATTTLVAWSNGTNELIIPTLKIGTAYFIEAFDGKFAPVFDVDMRFENRRSASMLHLGGMSLDFLEGLEFEYKKLASLRLGYSDVGTFNVGAGIRLPKLGLDYSFARFSSDEQLGDTHRISLTFTFEADRYKRLSE
ncbi:MAG: PorV/PorQ family protein [Ignavibacteriales bacterium]|nr:PorV/PorQ family protein [Ignavibacteriales bacterium]